MKKPRKRNVSCLAVRNGGEQKIGNVPIDKKLKRNTMNTLTAIPRDLVGDISERYIGETTVRPPEPKPSQIRAKYSRPIKPDAKICMKMPLAQRTTKPCQQRSLPKRSLSTSAISAPNAVPRTPNDVMFAVILLKAVSWLV